MIRRVIEQLRFVTVFAGAVGTAAGLIRDKLSAIFGVSILYRRRYSLLGAVICAVVIAVLIASLSGQFDIQQRSAHLYIGNSNDAVRIEVSHIRLSRGAGNDKLEIDIRGFAEVDSGAGHISVCAPNWLSYRRGEGYSGSFKYRGQWDSDGDIWRQFDYEYSEGVIRGATLVFDGDILCSSARESKLDFSIQLGDAPQSGSRITVSHLDGVDCVNVSPRPDYQSDYALDFPNMEYPKSRKVDLSLHLYNRLNAYRSELRVFFFAVIIGVLSSIIGNVVFMIIREIEGRRVVVGGEHLNYRE